ncbi:Hydrophobin [Mycena venus]|uniref:Hydrophobin n=1 Tax=Mycena venus TaxID=2733690 RepID=A0A8H6YYS5_9AGAR|nr:Hydrophobin [Mycena venus]
MKNTIIFCALSYAISVVGAVRFESNAQRLARGLPPLPPRRRFGSGAKRSTTSPTPFHCDAKKNFCCSNFQSASSPAAENILRGLGISQSSCGEQIATGCVAASGDSCSSGSLAKCCGNIVGSDLIGIDCTHVAPSTSSSHPVPSSSSQRSSSSASSSHASSSASSRPVSSASVSRSSSSASAPQSSSSSSASRASSSVSASASHSAPSRASSSPVPHSSSFSRPSSSASASASHASSSAPSSRASSSASASHVSSSSSAHSFSSTAHFSSSASRASSSASSVHSSSVHSSSAPQSSSALRSSSSARVSSASHGSNSAASSSASRSSAPSASRQLCLVFCCPLLGALNFDVEQCPWILSIACQQFCVFARKQLRVGVCLERSQLVLSVARQQFSSLVVSIACLSVFRFACKQLGLSAAVFFVGLALE